MASQDWENPSEKDIAEAKEHGLDLNDPTVRAELKRLSEEVGGSLKQCSAAPCSTVCGAVRYSRKRLAYSTVWR